MPDFTSTTDRGLIGFAEDNISQAVILILILIFLIWLGKRILDLII